ncbi:unnamed protein product, partial [Iphiclides podalirius]
MASPSREAQLRRRRLPSHPTPNGGCHFRRGPQSFKALAIGSSHVLQVPPSDPPPRAASAHPTRGQIAFSSRGERTCGTAAPDTCGSTPGAGSIRDRGGCAVLVAVCEWCDGRKYLGPVRADGTGHFRRLELIRRHQWNYISINLTN